MCDHFSPKNCKVYTGNEIIHKVIIVYHGYLVMMFPVSKIIDKKLCYPSTGSTTDYLLSVSIKECMINIMSLIL